MFVHCQIPSVLSVLLGSLILFFGSSLSANDIVRYVNMPRLLEQAQPAVSASKALELAFADREAELKAAQSDIKRLEDALNRAKEEEKPVIEQKLANQVREYKRLEQAFKRDLSVRKNQEYQRIKLIIDETINEYARQNAIAIILTAGVAYAAETHDITEAILEILNQIEP